MLFKNRQEAGQRLADELIRYGESPDLIILALPRGGVPVGYEVARRLNAPLDVFLVRKLGVPGQRELAFGALAYGGIRVLNHDVVRSIPLTSIAIRIVTARQQQELKRREEVYRLGRPAPLVQGKTVLLVDDGLATGATMRAALQVLRLQQPGRLLVGVPVAAKATCELVAREVDRIVCVLTPEPFGGVGRWYKDFSQTTDEEVVELLQKAALKE